MFSKRLKYLRKEKKLTQNDMAELLGITRQGYAKYENELGEPDIKAIHKLANFFDVSTDFLLGRSDIRKNDLYLAIEDLTPAQKEVLSFFLNSDTLALQQRPEHLLDALEEFELYYEMLKKREKRNKK